MVGSASGLTSTGWRGVARLILAMAGLALVAYLVRSAGPARVAEVLTRAGPWLPLILLLELVQPTTDFLALRTLLEGDAKKVPVATWARSSAIAYAMMSLVPAGRVAGEVTRAAMIAKHVGAPRAASVSARLQSAYLFANGVLSASACVASASWLGGTSPLSLLTGANALAMTFMSASLLAILWHGRVGQWLDAARRRFMTVAEPPGGAPSDGDRRIPYRAALFSTIGRSAQLVQYGVILHAVGGAVSVHGAFIAHGIHLVGASAGDMVPNQLGVIDGLYRTFAPVLGFASTPERALSMAFVAHITQLLCAGACVVMAASTASAETITQPPQKPRHEAAPASARAGVRS
jgi:hypothetical protein